MKAYNTVFCSLALITLNVSNTGTHNTASVNGIMPKLSFADIIVESEDMILITNTEKRVQDSTPVPLIYGNQTGDMPDY